MVAIGSLGTRVLSAANRIAPVAGAASGWLSAPMADGRGLAGAPGFMIERLKGFKIANPIITTEIALNHEDQYHLIGSAVSALTGLAVKEAGDAVDIPAVKQMGSALMKFGSSALVNGAIAAWVWEAVNNPHGVGAGSAAAYSYSTQSPASRTLPTINVDNPQGLTPLNAGTAPSFGGLM